VSHRTSQILHEDIKGHKGSEYHFFWVEEINLSKITDEQMEKLKKKLRNYGKQFHYYDELLKIFKNIHHIGIMQYF